MKWYKWFILWWVLVVKVSLKNCHRFDESRFLWEDFVCNWAALKINVGFVTFLKFSLSITLRVIKRFGQGRIKVFYRRPFLTYFWCYTLSETKRMLWWIYYITIHYNFLFSVNTTVIVKITIYLVSQLHVTSFDIFLAS